MTLARCEHCGAPLELIEGALTVRCSYCQHNQVVSGLVTAVEGPVAGAGAPKERYAVGQAVLCEWRGRWWPASILEARSSELYLIHYDGYSSSWDEVVGLERLAARSATPSAANPNARTTTNTTGGSGSAKAVIVLAALVAVSVAGLGAIALRLGQASSPPATLAPAATSTSPAPGQLAVGQPVLVLWGERWWNATVLRVHPDGRVRVHYDGWAESWDEDVTLDRVRLR